MQCGSNNKQKSAHFVPTFEPPLDLQNMATGFIGSIIWEDFARESEWTVGSSGGVYAAWTFKMGVKRFPESWPFPGGYMGAQINGIDRATLIFSAWDGDRSLGSGKNKEFKKSRNLVWPITMKEGQRKPGDTGFICQRNCHDCSLPHLRHLREKGFTTGTKCILMYNKMLKGGRWNL